MRRLFVLVAAVVMLDTTFYAAIAPLLPSYEAELGLSKAGAGVLSASYAAGTLLASVPAGYLAAAKGPRFAVLAGLALLALSSVAFAFAQTIVLLDAARFVQGIAGACAWSGGLAWIFRATTDASRGKTVGGVLAAAVAGVALGPVLGAAARLSSPELVFSLIGVVALVLAGFALATSGPKGSAPPALAAVWRCVARGPVLGPFALVALPALFSGTLAVLAPLRLDDLGAGALALGAVFLLAAAFEAALSPLVGRLSDRRGRMLPIRAGLAGAIPFAFLLAVPRSPLLLGVMVIATVGVLASFWGPALALASEAVEAAGLDQGFAGGIVNLAWAGGQVVGGSGGAALASNTADAVPYAIIGTLCAVALGLVVQRRAPIEAVRSAV